MGRIRTPRIVQPGKRAGLGCCWVLGILLLASWAWYAIESSQMYLEPIFAERDAQIAGLQDHIALLEKERDELRLRAAQYERSSQVDKSAVKLAQNDLKKLQEQRASLHQEVEFLKSLVSGDVTVLQLTDFKLRKLAKDRSYHYSLTVSKRAKGHERVQGKLALKVIGKLKGKPAELTMAKLGIDPQDLVMGFNFFQQFKGDLILPTSFKPEKIWLKVQPTGKTFETFERTFAWRPDE
jgi:hypothetical protein